MSNHLTITEHDDRYTISVEGGSISQIQFDYSISIWIALSEDVRLQLRVDGRADIMAAGTTDTINPESPASACPILHILHDISESLTAYKDGTLELALSGGYRVHIGPDPTFEAWEISTNLPLGLNIVSLPGGDLAVWLPNDHARSGVPPEST